MPEQIPFSVAGHLISVLGSPALEEIKLAYGAKKELKKLEETLNFVNAKLQDADKKQQQKGKLVEEWIRRLREVLYDADDLLDEVTTEGLRQKLDPRGRIIREVCDFFSSSNQLVFRVKLGHRIKQIGEKLDEVRRNMSQFNFLLDHKVVIDSGAVNNTRETDSEVSKDEIIGRDKSKKDIIKLLMQQQTDCIKKDVSMVAIVGMGGLGKTTLAQKVYNDECVERYFGKRMWVCVSEDFNVKSLARKILNCLIDGDVGDLDLQQLQSRLRQNLEGMRYLLVLDDVWNENEEKWDRLKKSLFYGAQGSKILVTTRSKTVATVMGVYADSLYELKGLSNEDSCILFEQKAFISGSREDKASFDGLLNIGKEVVIKRCKGVPLAIKTLASAVRSYPNETYWLSMKETEIWSLLGNKDDDDSIFPVLMLSYYHLPNHLKQCFAFCSIFPKDNVIHKQFLVKLWMAQGYVQSSTGGQDLEDIGDMYFHELLSRSFFQDAEKDDFGNIKNAKIHDLIHDLAQLVSGNECLVLPDFDKEKKVLERVHHLVVGNEAENITLNETVSILMSIWERKASLRTLFVLRLKKDETEPNIPDIVFSNLRYLRSLVWCFPIAKLPTSIDKLKHLRCLYLVGLGDVKKLPNTICNLLNLQTLVLRDCHKLEKLPGDIGKLVGLRHLIIEACPQLKCMPMGFGKLILLRELPTIYVTRENRYVLNELSGLDLLRGDVCLEGLENVRDVESEAKQVNLKRKKHLQFLRFTWSQEYPSNDDTISIIKTDESLLDNLEPHANLKAMLVKGYRGIRFSSWLSCITNLVRLLIRSCDYCKHLPPLDQLHSLKYLELKWMPSLEFVELSSEALSSSSSMRMTNRFFPSLEELIIHDCHNFKGWWRRSNDEDDDADVDVELQPCNWFSCLSTLSISNCPSLSSMPLFPTLEEKLELCKSSCVKPLQQTMQMKTTKTSAVASSCLLSSPPLSKLKRLKLMALKDLQSVALPEAGVRRLTSLESLKIELCHDLALMPVWVRYLTSLKRLAIRDCNRELSKRCRKQNGPDWWKIQHIPNIRTDSEEIGQWRLDNYY